MDKTALAESTGLSPVSDSYCVETLSKFFTRTCTSEHCLLKEEERYQRSIVLYRDRPYSKYLCHHFCFVKELDFGVATQDWRWRERHMEVGFTFPNFIKHL